MTALRALLAYEDLLRKFQNQLTNSPLGLEGTLEYGLEYLISRLRLRNVSLFWWDPQRNCLSMQYVLHQGALMEGEEEIIVDAGSPLFPLLDERRPVVISKKKPWTAFIPLRSGSDLVGAVRFERQTPFPMGKVMMPLSPMIANPGTQPRRTYPLLEDIADILSIKIQQLTRDEKHRKRAQYLQAASEVATAVFERPRLRDMLEAVSRSIVHNLGFDRIRFYLVDPEGSKLDGVMGLMIPDRVLDLAGESFPLRRGVNSLVDVVMSHGGDSNVHLVGGRVVYVPLAVNNQVLGCIAVDNLLSQQLMDEEQLEALRALVSQIGMAVLNARLFEDIEQQAITDGLTKLYVHRYFQQRLKEEIDRADRYSYSIALVMMDVDKFKTLNDQHGHLLGDRVLELLAQNIRSNIRRIDLAARYGGDEFVLVLPEITEQEAWLMGERLLNALNKSTVTCPDGQVLNVKVTMGAAMYSSDARNSRDLIESADKALYWAKKNSRGSICFYRTIAHNVEKSA
jgi:diguanylate cyclase (GGDEF)-like protein